METFMKWEEGVASKRKKNIAVEMIWRKKTGSGDRISVQVELSIMSAKNTMILTVALEEEKDS